MNSYSKLMLVFLFGSIQPLLANPISYSLEELSQMALNENPKLKHVSLQKEIELQKVEQIGELPDPSISYSWFGENVETRVGPQEQKFGIQQKIPWPGKLNDQKKVALQNTHVTETIISKSRVNLLLELRTTWSDIQYYHLSENIIDSTIILYQSWSKKLLSDYQSGIASYSKVLKMESEIDVLVDEKSTIQRILSDKNKAIQEIVSHSENFELDMDPNFESLAQAYGAKPFPSDFSQNPNVQNALSKQKLWQQKESLSRSGYIPDFTLGLSYIQTGEAPGMPSSGKDPWLINVGMTIPLSFSKTSASIEESKLGQLQAKSLEQEHKQFISRVLDQSRNQLEEALRKRKLYTSSLLSRLEQSIQVQEKLYQSSQQDFMQLLDDYRLRLMLQQKVYMTYNQELQAKAKLLWLLGDTDPQFVFPYQKLLNSNSKPALETQGN